MKVLFKEMVLEGKSVKFVAIECPWCGEWILEQEWARFIICPICGHLVRVPEQYLAQMREFFKREHILL